MLTDTHHSMNSDALSAHSPSSFHDSSDNNTPQEQPLSWDIDTSGFEKPKKQKNGGIPKATSRLPLKKSTKSAKSAGK